VGIRTVQISAVVDVAKMPKVSKFILGFSITSPLGDPHLEPEKEKAMRRRYVEKAIGMLREDG
jgi:hypothetical protein